MKKLIAISLFFLLIFTSCELKDDSTTPEQPDNGFASKEVAAVFAENCAISGCHAGTNPQNGLSLENYSSLMKGSSLRPLGSNGTTGGDVVIPFNSEKSLLYQMISGNASVRMPFNRTALSSTELSTVLNWINDGAKNINGEVPFTNPSYRVFVCNQGSDIISTIDGDNFVVSRLLDVDQTAGIDAPHMVKVKDGFLYATLISAGKLLKIRLNDYQIVGEVANLDYPGMIMITNDGAKAYVSRSSSAPGSYSSIYVIDIQQMVLLREVQLPVAGIPHGIALTPDNATLYAANLTKNRISIINAVTDNFVNDIVLSTTVDHEPMQTAISPDGAYLYVSARATGKLLVIETNTNSLFDEIDVGQMPMHIAVNSIGSKIYVPLMGDNAVAVVEKTNTTWAKTAEIQSTAFSMPHGADLSADDKYLFTSSRNLSGSFVPAYAVAGESSRANVAIINTTTQKVEKVLEIENYGAGLVVEK